MNKRSFTGYIEKRLFDLENERLYIKGEIERLSHLLDRVAEGSEDETRIIEDLESEEAYLNSLEEDIENLKNYSYQDMVADEAFDRAKGV